MRNNPVADTRFPLFRSDKHYRNQPKRISSSPLEKAPKIRHNFPRYCYLWEKGQNTLRHILVIDDEDGIRQIINLALSRYGVTVMEAATGEVGLAMALMSQPDAIIVDLRLPDISGVEVAARYQSQGGTSPIILLSASDELETKADHPAITRALAKPFTLGRLWSTVQSALTPQTRGANEPKRQIHR